MIKHYRKKPVEIETLQFTEETADEVKEWVISKGGTISGPYISAELMPHLVINVDPDDPVIKKCKSSRHLIINTLEGPMIADENDFIIRGIKGEFYSCKPDIFEQTYEAIAGEFDYKNRKNDKIVKAIFIKFPMDQQLSDFLGDCFICNVYKDFDPLRLETRYGVKVFPVNKGFSSVFVEEGNWLVLDGDMLYQLSDEKFKNTYEKIY